MEFTIENEILTIVLSGRLDGESVERVEREMMEISQAHPHKSLHVDARDLSYVASSGLRIMLKMAKMEKDFHLDNLCDTVYNVFEMTGFTKIMNIHKALRRVNLENCEILGAGGNGAIYRISEDEIVKVIFNQMAYQDLDKELARAKEAFLLGVPTAISFDMVDCGEGRRGLVYETIKSITLGETIQQEPERLEELTKQYIAQLNALHAIHTDNPVFGSAKDDYCQQVKNASKYLSEEEGQLLQQILDVLPEGDCLVHCDAHPKNLMIQNGEMIWIDMEKISVGHPIYDLISIAVTINSMTNPELAMKITGMTVPLLERLNDCFIRTYFNTDDPAKIKRYNDVFNSMRLVRTVFAIGLSSSNTEKYRPAIIEMARKVFFPNISNIALAIKMLVQEIDAR